MNEREIIHRRVWDILPWYINGTLEPAERRRVEEHLAGCPHCREEADRSRGLAHLVREADEVAPSPHPVQLQRLLARLDADPDAESDVEPDVEPDAKIPGLSGAEGAGRRPPATQAWARRGRQGPAWLRWLAAAQAAALVALVALLVVLLARPAAEPAPAFRTLSSPASAPISPGAAGAVRIRLLFAPETPERDIRALLAAVEGQISGGPSPLGVYTVEIPAGPAADPLPVVLAHLRSRPAVHFAEPAAEAAPVGAPVGKVPGNFLGNSR